MDEREPTTQLPAEGGGIPTSMLVIGAVIYATVGAMAAGVYATGKPAPIPVGVTGQGEPVPTSSPPPVVQPAR